MKDKYIYPAIFHVAEEGGYWIEFQDLPMANTQGEDLEECSVYGKRLFRSIFKLFGRGKGRNT